MSYAQCMSYDFECLKDFSPSSLETYFLSRADEKYREFSCALSPGARPMIGIRTPELRALAAWIAKHDWQSYLEEPTGTWFEEVMLRGMVIGNVPVSFQERLTLIDSFIPLIDSWSICDSFCCGLSVKKQDLPALWNYCVPFLTSKEPYAVRFAIITLMVFFVKEPYIVEVLQLISNISSKHYYIQMGGAWALSVCYIKFPDLTEPLLHSDMIEENMRKKAIRKIIESRRVSEDAKAHMRQLLKKA